MGYSSQTGLSAPFSLSEIASRIGHSSSKTLSAILNSSNYYKLAVNKPENSNLVSSKGLEINSYSSGSGLYNSGGFWDYPSGPTRASKNMGQLLGYSENSWSEGQTVNGRYRIPFGYFTYSGAGSFYAPLLRIPNASDYPGYTLSIVNSWDLGGSGAKSPLNILDLSSALGLSSSYIGVALVTSSGSVYVKTRSSTGVGSVDINPTEYMLSNPFLLIPVVSSTNISSGSGSFSSLKPLGYSFQVNPVTIVVQVVCNSFSWIIHNVDPETGLGEGHAYGTFTVKNTSSYSGCVKLTIRFNPTGGDHIEDHTQYLDISSGETKSLEFDYRWDTVSQGASNAGYAHIEAGSSSVSYSGSHMSSYGYFQ